MDRILKLRTGSYTLTANAYDHEGVDTTITGTPELVVTDSAGTAMGTYTPSIVAGDLVASIPSADLPYLDTYDCVWSYEISGTAQEVLTQIELVGGFYFEIYELRAGSPKVTLTDEVTYPDALLTDKRTGVEQIIEEAAGVAFVPRGHRYTHYAGSYGRICLPHTRIRALYGITIDGGALTPAEIATLKLNKREGRINRGWWDAGTEVVIHYEHGHTLPPLPIKDGAIRLAIERVVGSAVPDRATGVSTDTGFQRFTLADGMRHPTGLPDLDAAIRQFGDAGVPV